MATDDLHRALEAAGQPVELGTRLDRSGAPVHAHLGNSTRQLLPNLALRKGDLVTLHDVVPRQLAARRLLTPVQVRILRRHHVAVHSNHATELLRSVGFSGPTFLTPPLSPVTPIDPNEVKLIRKQWGSHDYDLTLISAGQLRQSKGVEELIGAAHHHPTLLLVLLGRVTDKRTHELLESKPPNVIHTEAERLVDFCHRIASADALVNLRRETVGESSGPVVQAHRLHKPVIGLHSGSLPEHCGPGDLLVSSHLDAVELLATALSEPLEDLPAAAPQIPDPAAVARVVSDVYRQVGLT